MFLGARHILAGTMTLVFFWSTRFFWACLWRRCFKS